MNCSPLCRLLAGTTIAVATLIAGAMTGCGAGGTTRAGNQVSTIPAPTIFTTSPTSNLAGSSAFTLSVIGANFLSSSVVYFGGTAVATTFVNSTQLTAAIPAPAVASVGIATVTVTNPGTGGGTSNGASFAINSGSNPIPTISSLDPGCAPVGAPTFALYVTGTNFVPGTVV